MTDEKETKRARLHETTPFAFGAPHLSDVRRRKLDETAKKLCSSGKGISACDESASTIGKRFLAVGIENTEEHRRSYRQMLFESEGVESYLSGVIMDPETLYQKSSNGGTLFPEVLAKKGVLTGVKPHLKVYELPGTSGDTVMQGLDSLAGRLREYVEAGAKFAKWRSPLVIDVSKGRPTNLAIRSNMADLARYALICQSEGIMPIVEPDVSLVGSHTLEDSVRINVQVQAELFRAMIDHGVYMSGATLKSNMINPGKNCSTPYTVEKIAEANLFVLRQSFPVAIKGNNFLSGGQTLEQAAARLSAINKRKQPSDPWNLSFSWSAAIQLPLLALCKETGTLRLNQMSDLYKKGLHTAHLASIGKLDTVGGDHDGTE